MRASVKRLVLVLSIYTVSAPYPIATAQDWVPVTATQPANTAPASSKTNNPAPQAADQRKATKQGPPTGATPKTAQAPEKKAADQTRASKENMPSQTQSKPKHAPEKVADGKAPPAAAQVPGDLKLVAMIRSTAASLNHANTTGNYSVFRELGSTSFQNGNSTARLSSIFSKLRSRNLDLSAALVLEPKLIRAPNIYEKSRLRLTGFFPSKPERIDFDMIFEQSGGDWKLFGIALDTTRPQSAEEKRSAVKPASKAEEKTGDKY